MPLKVGNYWKYYVQVNQSPYCIHFYDNVDQLSYVFIKTPKAENHYETYKVVGQDQYADFWKIISITTEPEISQKSIRDGRYYLNEGIFWKWNTVIYYYWDEKGELESEKAGLGLNEYIDHWPNLQKMTDDTLYLDYLIKAGKIKTKGQELYQVSCDDRIPLHVITKHDPGIIGNGLKEELLPIWSDRNPIKYIYDYTYRDIKIESLGTFWGNFSQCIETIEQVYQTVQRKDLAWSTHMFWCPYVGKVKEYQKLADGTITYEMNLVEYKVQ
jgi:hypothetical protein